MLAAPRPLLSTPAVSPSRRALVVTQLLHGPLKRWSRSPDWKAVFNTGLGLEQTTGTASTAATQPEHALAHNVALGLLLVVSPPTQAADHPTGGVATIQLSGGCALTRSMSIRTCSRRAGRRP